jgi:chromosome segregation ATPase
MKPCNSDEIESLQKQLESVRQMQGDLAETNYKIALVASKRLARIEELEKELTKIKEERDHAELKIDILLRDCVCKTHGTIRDMER